LSIGLHAIPASFSTAPPLWITREPYAQARFEELAVEVTAELPTDDVRQEMLALVEEVRALRAWFRASRWSAPL
jgi:hypothetical protein